MNEDEREAAHIYDLPSTLHNALKELRKDEVMKDALGMHIFNNFNEAKRVEWAAYRQIVCDWEREQYMELY
jgi:glutamine synthetase